VDRRSFVRSGAQAALAFGILPRLERGALLAQAAGTQSEFTRLRDRYFVKVLDFNPVTATYLGGDAYTPQLRDVNTRLRDFRPASIEQELQFYRLINAAREAIDPSTLTPEERIDREVLKAQLDFIIHQLGDLRYYQRSVDTYVQEPFRGVDWQIQQMADAGHGLLGSEDEWEMVAKRVGTIPAYLEVARTNLLAGKAAGNIPDWRMVQRDGVAGSRSNADYFRTTLPDLARRLMGTRAFAARMLPRVAQAAAAATAAWTQFAAFLEQTYAGDGTDRFAIGTAEYEWRVRNNLHETRTAAQLSEYGQRQVDAYQARMYEVAQAAAREAGLTLPWGTREEKNAGVRAVMESLGKDSPRSDDELLRWYVDTGRRAVAYGRERQLFDIPADYRLDVYPTPPVLRSTIDAAD
jgi:uncharacterized protein (DUF885 family)